MYRFDDPGASGQQILCRTEAGLEMRRVVRWMISEPESPWCAALLPVVKLKRGEQIGWDEMGYPVARRTRIRWQTQNPDGRAVLAELAYAVLEELALDMGVKRCDEMVAGVDRWAGQTGRPPVGATEIHNAIRFLRKKGYVERGPRGGSPVAFRLTPSGYAVTVLHRRASRKETADFDLPAPEQVGHAFEDLEVQFLDLSLRTREALADAGVRTVRALLESKRLSRLVGEEAVAEIVPALALLGLQPA